MAGLLDLFSGRSSDLYGGALTPEQRGGMGNIGLLALAGKLGQLAGPSFSPVPDFGAAIGQAAGAYGASQEGAGTAALNAILTGQRGRKLEQELDYYKQLGPVLGKLAGQWPGADGGTAATPETGSTGGGAAAPPGAGGNYSPTPAGSGMSSGLQAADVYGHAISLGATPNEAALLTSAAQSESSFRPDISHDGGIGYGLFGHNGARLRNMQDQAGTPKPAWQDQVQFALAELRKRPESSLVNAAKTPEELTQAQMQFEQPNLKINNGNFAGRLAATRQYMANPPSGAAPAAAAPAPDAVRVPYNYGAPAAAAPALNVGERATPLSPGGGLLAPTAPNPLSDADPMLPIVRPAAPGAGAAAVAPNQVGRFAGIAPGTPVNSRGFPYNPEITDPAVAARVAQSMAAIKQAQQSGVPWAATRESSGSSAAAPADIYAGYPTTAEEAGGGGGDVYRPEAPFNPNGYPGEIRQRAGSSGVWDQYTGATPPAAMASGLLTPGGPLTRGVPGMPAMPPAAAPSADPSLQLGPLAPAPAAAAPAAPGPGLLSPPGMPAAPALPRVNPAYDAYARNLAVAAGLVKGAGLPDVLAPLLEAFKGSPGYRAQQTIAEKGAAQPFEQAQTLFNKQVEIAGVGPIEAAKLPYALAQAYFKAEQDIRTAGPVAAAQNFERIKADNAAKAIITTKDADGNIKLAIDPVALKAASGAAATIAGDTAGAQEKARLEQQAGLQPGITRETESQKGFAAQDTSARAQALAAKEGLYLLGDARQQLEGAGIFSGALANPKMTLAQYYSGLTGVPNQQLINTQVFLQQAGARSAAILQAGTYGTGTAIGARDLDAANKLANGDNTVDLESIKRVFDLTEKTAHRKIEMFNDMIRERDPRSMINPPPASASAGTAGGLDFSKMSLPDLTAAVTRGDLTIDQRKAIDKRFRELGH